MSIATAVPNIPTKVAAGPPGRRYDHYFFSGMALLILFTVFLGFARSYYLAGMFNAPLPSRIIHLHGAAFTCWILLLVTQTSLVASGRVDIHRRLGIVGFFLACLMLVLGVLASTDQLAHRVNPEWHSCKTFLHHSYDGHADFWNIGIFCLSRSVQSLDAQAPDPGGHRFPDDCRHRALAAVRA
jgi:disulfide bond formation protein DsbB